PFVDAFFQLQIEVRLQASSRANRCHARGEIEPGKTQGHVMVKSSARGVEEMVMHADEPGQSRVTGEVQPIRACGDLDRTTRADRGDLVGGDQYRLVGLDCASGTVDQAHMLERNHPVWNLDKVFRRKSRLRLGVN